MGYAFFFSCGSHKRFLELQQQLERISVSELLNHRFFYLQHSVLQSESTVRLDSLRTSILSFVNTEAPYCDPNADQSRSNCVFPPALILDESVFLGFSFHEKDYLIMKLKKESRCAVILCIKSPMQHRDVEDYTKMGFDDFFYENESARMCLWKLQRSWEHYVVKRILHHTRRGMEHFHHLSMYDELTGLYNMRYFYDCLKKHAGHASSGMYVSLVMLDVDHLKRINDCISHLAGSQILSRVGELIRGHIRYHDVAARFGGDEFVVILNHTHIDGAKIVATRLMRAISQMEIELEGWNVKVSVSCGITHFNIQNGQDKKVTMPSLPSAGEHLEEKDEPSVYDHFLLKKADHYLYQAKKNGRSCISFEGQLIKPVDARGVPLVLTQIVRVQR